MPAHRKDLRPLAALVTCVILVVVAVAFIDRPASTWAHSHFHRPAIFNQLTQFPDPIPLLATVGLIGAGAAALFGGWRPADDGKTLIAMCTALLVGEGIKEQLKHFFGRPWPETWTSSNPSWITSQAADFNLLHGGSGWQSFPSGHMTQITVIAAVLWFRIPRLRWAGVALALLVAAALWMSNYHFVGDIVAGAFLGTACGVGAVRAAGASDGRPPPTAV